MRIITNVHIDYLNIKTKDLLGTIDNEGNDILILVNEVLKSNSVCVFVSYMYI